MSRYGMTLTALSLVARCCKGDHACATLLPSHVCATLLATRMPTHRALPSMTRRCPQGAAFAKSSNALFIADHINGRVVVFDTNTMEHMRTFGSRGHEAGELEYPVGIAIKGEEVFVAEYGNHRISVFTKRGVFVRILGGEGKGPGQLFEPRGLAIVKGWVVVLEARRVQVLSPEGESRQVLDIPGAGSLWGVCKDEQSRAFVTDIRAGQAKVYVLQVVGQSYDEGASASALANAAAQKAAEAAAKLKEWKESKMKKAAEAEAA